MSQNDNEIKRQLAGIFNRVARSYDRVGPHLYSILGDRLVQRAALCPGAQVLDVAAGRGAALIPAARAVGPEGYVTGIDLAPEMVEAACTEIMRWRLINADVRVMDAEDINYSSFSFDNVICSLAVFLFPNTQKALWEMYRVLTSSGRAAFSVWDRDDERWAWLNQMILAYTQAAPPQPGQPIFLAPARHLNQPGALEAALQATGFVRIETYPEETELIYANEEEWWAMQRSHGVRAFIDWLEAAGGPENVARFKAEAFEKMQPLRQIDGFHQIMRIRCIIAHKEYEI